MEITEAELFKIVLKFNIKKDSLTLKPFGSGHINDSYRVKSNDPKEPEYLLQRINHHVFKDVPALMNNIVHVICHLKEKTSKIPGVDPNVQVLTLVKTLGNKDYFEDIEGNYWRLYHFLKDTKNYDIVETEKQATECGKAFGRFLFLLSDLDSSMIVDTIPDFHNIEKRLDNLQKAIMADTVGRMKLVQSELAFVNQRAEEMGEIMRLGRTGLLPLRIIHNDTKINNVLLNSQDNAQCVIDLDTVMKGYVPYDFGDAIRTLANTAAEDEKDLSLIDVNIHLFEAYTDAYLKETTGFLTEGEVDALSLGVRLLPYMQAVRFLTDYLEGDHYFKIHFPEHNLQRTRAQLQLLKKLDTHNDHLYNFIKSTWEKHKLEACTVIN